MATKENEFENLCRDIAELNFDPGCHFYAKPTYIIDPHNFFLIPFPFLYYLPALTRPGKPYLFEELQESRRVIYTSKQPDLNQYLKIDNMSNNIRGIVLQIGSDKKCCIHAIDYGFVENDVSIDRIYHPCNEAINTPSMTQHCELFLCEPKGLSFSEAAINAFKFYIGNEKLSVVVQGQCALKIQIVVYNSNPDDIATLLALTHYTFLVRHFKKLDYSGFFPDKLEYEYIQMNVGETALVRVQSGSSLNSFYVSPMSTYNEYLQNRADLNAQCRYLPEISSDDFTPGKAVAVHHDDMGLYERAVILEVEEDRATVMLVDWGTECEVPKNKVKGIKRFFATPPANAIYCSAVNGFQPWDNGLSQFLYKGYTFLITVQHVGDGFDTPHIVNLTRQDV